MVSLGLIIAGIAGVVLLTQIENIKKFGGDFISSLGGEGSSSSFTEGDITTVEGDVSTTTITNTSEGKPLPTETQTIFIVSPSEQKKVSESALTKAFEEGRFTQPARRSPTRLSFRTTRPTKPILSTDPITRETREALLARTSQDLISGTSIAGAQLRTGIQIKRGTDTLNLVKEEEARRSQEIFNRLFGNVQNPNF